MDLVSALNELEENNISSGLACSTGTFLKTLEEKERKAFEAVLEKRTVTVPQLFEMLKKNGYEVAERSLYKHRQKKCRCF